MVTECLDSSICLDGKSDLSCGVVNCNMILALECGTIIRYSFLWSLYNSMWLALSICPCTTFMQGLLSCMFHLPCLVNTIKWLGNTKFCCHKVSGKDYVSAISINLSALRSHGKV